MSFEQIKHHEIKSFFNDIKASGVYPIDHTVQHHLKIESDAVSWQLALVLMLNSLTEKHALFHARRKPLLKRLLSEYSGHYSKNNIKAVFSNYGFNQTQTDLFISRIIIK